MAFVVVPNIPYALLIAEYDLRPRTSLILLYWCIGVVAPKSPAWLVACAMAAVVGLDLVWFVSGLFSLTPSLVVESFKYAPLIYPAASWLYLGMGAGAVAAVLLPTYLVARHRGLLLRGRLLGGCLLAITLAADLALTINPPSELPEFDSAMRRSGLERNESMRVNGALLVVMVENLGVFADPEHNRRLFEGLQTQAVRARYRVREGVSPSVGATTSATLRELCGRWAAYRSILAGEGAKDHDCMPARLAAQGYETHAIHAYSGRMFDRFDWYPRIGFQHLVFEEQMRARGERGRCGAVFRSACDQAAANLVKRLLTESGDQPRFVYWLTVDSHMPIEPLDGGSRWDCMAGGPFGNKTVCLVAQIWADVIDATAGIATDPGLAAPTAILVVGDHPPGFVSRGVQRYFLPGVVPWIALEPLGGWE